MNETSQARGCPPYITRGSALRPTPFLAPPFFEAFREVSQRAFLNSDRLTPCIHQSGASCLAPFPSHQPRRKRREKPTCFTGGFLCLALYARVLGHFYRHGKGRSVVRGGWRSQAGVVAKMAKWSWCCWRCGSVLGGVVHLVVAVVCVEVCCNGGRDMSVQNNDR